MSEFEQGMLTVVCAVALVAMLYAVVRWLWVAFRPDVMIDTLEAHCEYDDAQSAKIVRLYRDAGPTCDSGL